MSRILSSTYIGQIFSPKVFSPWHSDILMAIRARQSDRASYNSYAKLMLTHPIYFILMSLVPFSVLSGFTGTPFKQQPDWLNHLVLGGALLVNYAALRMWFGRWLLEGVARNIPTVWVYCAFYTTAHVVFHLIFGPLVFDKDFAVAWGRFQRTYAIALPVSFAFAYYFTEAARQMLGSKPELVPTVLPISRSTAKKLAVLSDLNLDTLVAMHAKDKGTVLVTLSENIFVRRALSEMVETVGLDLGFHCHRALWVSKAFVTKVIYLNGNPHVELTTGEVHPISRKAVAEIKRRLLKVGN